VLRRVFAEEQRGCNVRCRSVSSYSPAAGQGSTAAEEHHEHYLDHAGFHLIHLTLLLLLLLLLLVVVVVMMMMVMMIMMMMN